MPPGNEPRPFSAGVLRDAFATGQFFLVYQPIFDLQSSAFVGVEALMRWRHPEFGPLGASAFIEVLESSDLAHAVGQWTLETACVQGAEWHDAGYRFRVSVNVSARQWSGEGFVDDVRDALSFSRFEPSLLVLEVSRSTLRADPAARERVAGIAALGVHCAVDDFVPTPGGLEELERLGVDVVKIDRAYLAESSDDAVVVALAEQARDLGMQVIAAGIEDDDQRDRLARERVTSGQGFALSRPYEAEEIDRVLEDFSIFSGKPL